MSRFHGNDCLEKRKLGKKYRELHLSINSEEGACEHTHKCSCPYEGQCSTLGIFLFHSPPCFLRDLSLNVGLKDSACAVVKKEVPLIHLSLLHLHPLPGTCQHAQLLSGFWVSHFKCLVLTQKALTR